MEHAIKSLLVGLAICTPLEMGYQFFSYKTDASADPELYFNRMPSVIYLAIFRM